MIQFNKDQLAALRHFNGPMMVLAGPGSGKTTVITGRVAELIGAYGVSPENILVITFTRAAAVEMERRYMERRYMETDFVCHASGTKNKAGVTFGTFHSVFLSCLAAYGHDEFKNGFRLVTHAEALKAVREAVSIAAPDFRLTGDYYDELLSQISMQKNGLSLGEKEIRPGLVSSVRRIYDERLERSGLMDFDDMLVRTLRLLRSRPEVLDALRKRYRYIMVDEFQDINPVQFEIVRLLAAPLDNLFIVGDDDQSIYAFRGSDPGIMLDFKKYYPDSLEANLFTNYRSSKIIVSRALRLINHNKIRYRKRLKAFKPPGEKVSFHASMDTQEEADEIINIIRKINTPKTIGILYRTHRAGVTVNRRLQRELKCCDSLRRHCISSMTFHASKGLEFDIVFIVSADDSITPGVRDPGNTAAIEEERRLMYVAVTRAKEKLHIFFTKYIYNNKQKKSRFLKEMLL